MNLTKSNLMAGREQAPTCPATFLCRYFFLVFFSALTLAHRALAAARIRARPAGEIRGFRRAALLGLLLLTEAHLAF